MLSRVAESMFWMNRYMERAENVARFIMVNLNTDLDHADDRHCRWWPIVVTTGDDQLYLERYGAFTRQEVIQFLTFEPDNRNSIIACLAAARENARGIRDMISTPMWEHISKTFFWTRDRNLDDVCNDPLKFYSEITMCGQQFGGVMDATLSRSEAWHFGQLGRYLERAEKTTRLMDVTYLSLVPREAGLSAAVPVTQDEIQWLALLRSASALEMYRQRHGSITPQGVAELLIFDVQVPRSVRFCVHAANRSLHTISGKSIESHANEAELQIGHLHAKLANANVAGAIQTGLHEYLSNLLLCVNRVGEAINETFFVPPAAPLVGHDDCACAT